LLTATQEKNFKGTEGIPAMPFEGIIIAHSNMSEWESFKNNKNNEAFLDRVYIVKVPYCLRVDEEVMIYKKLLQNSSLSKAPCAPYTLKMLASFMVLSRLKPVENSSIFTKLRVYNGENVKNTDPNAKSITEYRELAGVDEGMDGLSTRFAFKILSRVFNFDHAEVAANPIHLMYILQKTIEENQFDEETTLLYQSYLNDYLQAEYKKIIGKEIQQAYLESYADYGQNIFDRYVKYADAWIQDVDYRDPETGERYDRAMLNEELEKIEKPAVIGNPKDFRHEVVNYTLRYKAKNNGKMPDWTKYEKIREVIEKKMFANTEDILPIISFSAKTNKVEQQKHEDFVKRMVKKGYTERQVRLVVEWYMRTQKSE
jgi:serine protein kinase